MPVFKYVSPAAVIRYLTTWSLRITPPDQFNDPFELRPRLTVVTPEALRKQAPNVIREELFNALSDLFAKIGITDSASVMLGVRYLLSELDGAEEAAFAKQLTSLAGTEALTGLEGFRSAVQAQLDAGYAAMERELPSINQKLQAVMHTTLQRIVGILCLSRSGKNSLMWSHYADSHQGALLEFDDGHQTFKRRRTPADEFGHLCRVSYSDTRPELGAQDQEEDVFVHLALTKALEWNYEQEVRLLLPLENADKTIQMESGNMIHLISVPPDALRSITFGCRATEEFIAESLALLKAHPTAAHVRARRSVVDEVQYALNYTDMRR